MKGDHQVIITVLAFFSGVIFNDLISNHNSYNINNYTPALATLISVFLGARYAFALKTTEDDKKRHQDNLMASNIFSLNLILMLNRLLNYDHQFIKEFRNHELYSIAIKPSLEIKDEYKVDLNSISFLINSNTENASFVTELSIVISKYKIVLDAINMRSVFHRDVIQPLLEKAGIKEDEEYPIKIFIDALGDSNYARLDRQTTDLINNLDECINHLQCISKKFTNKILEIYPGENIVILSDNKI